MMKAWQDRLRRGLTTHVAQRERRLFQELNPGLDRSPILASRPSAPRPAAVMIGIRETRDPTIVLTLRSPTMPSHAGQISLPGGGPKDGDKDAVATALRETDEEVGVPASAIEVLGRAGPHHGGLGYVVTPVIGLIEPSAPVIPCPREVAEAFEVPLRAILDPANHVIQQRNFSGTEYDMYAVPVYDTEGRERNIWGLTAGILRTLSELFDHEDQAAL